VSLTFLVALNYEEKERSADIKCLPDTFAIDALQFATVDENKTGILLDVS